MTVLADDLVLNREIGEQNAYPMDAAKIYEGSLVGLIDSTGYARALVAGDVFVGHAVKQVDNSDGSAGDKNMQVYTGRYRAEVALVVTLIDIGRAVYATDDNVLTMDPPATGAMSLVGRVWRRVSATKAVVEFRTNPTPADEAIAADSMLLLDEDFHGDWSTIAGPWKVVDVGDATEAGKNEVNGVFELAIAATSEAEDAVLYHGDKLTYDIDQLKRVEMRLAAVTPGTGVTCVWGMAGAHNLDKDTVAQNAWFRLDSSLALDVESDDGTNDNDDKTTGLTLVTATYYDFAIDFSDSEDVKFYVNGTQVATGTTYDMSNYTAGLQPYLSLDKASGTETGALKLDRIRIYGRRN